MRRSAWIAALLVATSVAADDSGEVAWHFRYSDARRESEASKKPLLLYVGRQHVCGLEHIVLEMFGDKNVAKLLNERFIKLKINASAQPRLAEILRVNAYPTIMIATWDGLILKKFEGYRPPSEMCEQLQKILVQTSKANAVPEKSIPKEISEPMPRGSGLQSPF